MNKHPYYPINLGNGARLILTPCPGSKDVGLSASLDHLAQADTKLLLTLMFDDEMESNDILMMPSLCEKHGIAWLQLPIVDDDYPRAEFEHAWRQFHQRILATINNGYSVAIHCKGGTGRTGLVAAMIMSCYGWPIEKIINSIQLVRPQALKIKTQLAYLNNFIERGIDYNSPH